jgi:hypothetical protein
MRVYKRVLSALRFLFFLAFLAGFLLKAGTGHADLFSRLQNDYLEYGGSEYLNHNLSERAPVLSKKGEDYTEPARELKAVQDELARRKAREAKALELGIIKNGIFEPEHGLWTSVKAVPDVDDIKGFERLLHEDYALETVLTVALRTNPDIRKAYTSARASIEKYDQVSNLDEILNQYSVFTKNLDIRLGKPLHNKPLILNFPFPGMLSLKGNIVDREVLISRLRLERTVEDLITRVKEAYYETAYLDHAIQITEETLELLKRLREVVNTVYTTGKSTLNDVVKIQIEIDRIENDLVEFEEKRKTMQVRLNKLLNISEDFVPEKIEDLRPVFLDYVKEDLLKDGEEGRTEIKTLVADLEKMQLLIEMAEKRFYPDFTLGTSLFQNRLIKQVGTGAELPAFPERPMVRGPNWFGSNDAYIRETKIKYQAFKNQIKELKNRTVDDINQAVYRYENADRLKDLFESKLVPKSRLTVDITETMYITGKVDFLDLINSQQLFLSYSLSLKKAIKDMNVEAAKIERLVGSTIKRKTDGGRSQGG